MLLRQEVLQCAIDRVPSAADILPLLPGQHPEGGRPTCTCLVLLLSIATTGKHNLLLLINCVGL